MNPLLIFWESNQIDHEEFVMRNSVSNKRRIIQCCVSMMPQGGYITQHQHSFSGVEDN